jgi:phenylalanyl-tRNA synthetase alpha subunit
MLQVQAFQADRCFRYEMDAEELAEWLQWEGCFFDRVLVDGKEV